MKISKSANLIIRYSLAVLFGLFLSIFYIIFTPLTIYPVYFLLSLFYPVVLSGSSLIISSAKITLVPACIAGSAYYLLFILNLLTPIPLKTRIKAMIFSILTLLALNIARIALFSALYLKDFQYFDLAHLFFWYVLSILFVFLIWLGEIKIYKINNIPVYTDLKYLLSLMKNSKQKEKKPGKRKRK